MSSQQFFSQLTLISFAMICSMFLLHLIPEINLHQKFSWASIAFFISLNVLMYGLAVNASNSANKHSFTSVIVASVLFKMVFSIVLVLVYRKVAAPQSRHFLIPFFWAYLIYTIFETHFMTKLGRLKPAEKAYNNGL